MTLPRGASFRERSWGARSHPSFSRVSELPLRNSEGVTPPKDQLIQNTNKREADVCEVSFGEVAILV